MFLDITCTKNVYGLFILYIYKLICNNHNSTVDHFRRPGLFSAVELWLLKINGFKHVVAASFSLPHLSRRTRPARPRRSTRAALPLPPASSPPPATNLGRCSGMRSQGPLGHCCSAGIENPFSFTIFLVIWQCPHNWFQDYDLLELCN
jgi:hypothetical protein